MFRNKSLLTLLLLALVVPLSAQRIKPSQLAAVQQRLWQAACRDIYAMAAHDSLVLPDFSEPISYTSPAAAIWQLPDSLERNAQMPMALGSKGSRPAEGFPLFLYIHGSGPPEDEWRAGLYYTALWKDAPSLYVVPRIPNDGEYYRWFQQAKQWAWERLFRLAYASGQINPNRLYVVGISEGAYGSQRLASFYGDYWAGAGPMAGGEPLMVAPVDNLSNLAFSLETGSDDYMYGRDTLTTMAAQALDSIAALYPGYYAHSVRLQAGRGHGIDYSTTTPWIAQFTRNPRPHWWRWECFPMGARYRSGYFNLRIDEWERPAAPSPYETGATNHYDGTAPRRMHEMRINGNEVQLTIDDVEYAPLNREPNWNIPLRYQRTYRPATSGRYTLFLAPDMVDAQKPITLVVNGKVVFSGKLPMREENIRSALREWGDPERMFPMAVSFAL